MYAANSGEIGDPEKTVFVCFSVFVLVCVCVCVCVCALPHTNLTSICITMIWE